MNNKPKRGRPPKEKPLEGEVMPPETKPNENYSKKPIMSGRNDKITITVSEDGRRHIDCGGFTIVEAFAIVSGVAQYMYAEMAKGLNLNGTKEGTTDAPSGGDS
jgi:hypothetical protein